MESLGSQGSQAAEGSETNGSHAVVACESLMHLAERELSQALALHVRPSIGMYAPRSRDGDYALHRAIHVLCADAHRLGLHAEEMLIALKRAWAHLATTRAQHLGDRDGDVFRDVVTTSIEVYVGARPPEQNQTN